MTGRLVGRPVPVRTAAADQRLLGVEQMKARPVRRPTVLLTLAVNERLACWKIRGASADCPSSATGSSATAGRQRWSTPTVRSTGSACPTTTARPSSGRCWTPSAAVPAGSGWLVPTSAASATSTTAPSSRRPGPPTTRSWSERLGAFRQRYDADSLDASALLIPIFGFLPADDPRALSTAERIATDLAIDGFVHRSIPAETPGHDDDSRPVGEFEGAFLPVTFWLATVYARVGRTAQAAAILDRVETVAGDLGLFAEEVDACTGAFLGNFPLLFSQAEYVRAALELADAPEGGSTRGGVRGP